MDLQALAGKKIPDLRPKTGIFLEKVKTLDASGGIFNFVKVPAFLNISMYQLALKFKEDNNVITADDFIEFTKRTMTDVDCQRGELLTRDQSKSTAWYELRFGRITASRLFETSRCQTTDGALMEKILGATKPIVTEPIRRGLLLEDKVLKEVEQIRKLKINRCGLLLDKNFPLFGASPDGLTDDFCIEVKCPYSEKTIKNYISDDIVNQKYLAQMQLQMLFSKRTRGLFCVAAPNFEQSKDLQIKEVAFDENFCFNLMEAAQTFWKAAIFPKL